MPYHYHNQYLSPSPVVKDVRKYRGSENIDSSVGKFRELAYLVNAGSAERIRSLPKLYKNYGAYPSGTGNQLPELSYDKAIPVKKSEISKLKKLDHNNYGSPNKDEQLYKLHADLVLYDEKLNKDFDETNGLVESLKYMPYDKKQEDLFYPL